MAAGCSQDTVPHSQAGLRQGQGLLRCCQTEPSCTEGPLGVFWELRRPFRTFWVNKHCMKDNTDLYSILTELLRSLCNCPSRGRSSVQSQPSKVESTRSYCRLRS